MCGGSFYFSWAGSPITPLNRIHELLPWNVKIPQASGITKRPDLFLLEKDVYRIYSLLLQNPRTSHGPDNNPRYLIAEKTSASGASMTLEGCIRPPKGRDVEFQEVLADFENRKNTPRHLRRDLSISQPYELLSEDDVKTFIHTPRGRRGQIDPRFEGVTDLFSFSDVYFSKSGNLALTMISRWCGGLCGLWRWTALEKLPSGEWQERPWVGCVAIAQAPRSDTRACQGLIGAATESFRIQVSTQAE